MRRLATLLLALDAPRAGNQTKERTMKKLIALIIASCGLALHAHPAHAATDSRPNCALYSNSKLMSWPATSPVWQFCWRRPDNSGPQPAGSGVELFDIHYNGHLVFSHLNVPVLNVEYGPGGCGCYRDWLDEEVRFEAVGSPCGDGYCKVIQPARTTCDCAPTDTCDSNPNNECNVDLGSFTGVAAEKESDHLTMTTQMSAGWYRYSQYLTFYLDGSIHPEFAFASVPNGCTGTTHFHHGYYRFDFDIDGPANDTVFRETLSAGDKVSDGDGGNDNVDEAAGPGGTDVGRVLVSTEEYGYHGDTVSWLVKDTVTKRGYRVIPGADDQPLPITNFDPAPFAVGDYWVLAEHDDENDDLGAGCAININPFVNGEDTARADVVLWYRYGTLHEHGDECFCGRRGPTLVPIGNWLPTP
jgi:hypothetical protein